MTEKTEPVAHGKMRPKPGSPPGIELDGKGNVIPLSERTEDDREAAMAGPTAGSVKDPEDEAETPSPMPRDLQGKGGKPDRDPEGQQGEQR
jgi:hypothetical protein